MLNHAITVYIDTAFELALEWHDADDVPVDLTGWSALMQVRLETDSGSWLLSAESPAQIELTDQGEITVTIDPFDTVGLTPGTAVWDLVLTSPSGDPQPPLVGGTATIRRPVSR